MRRAVLIVVLSCVAIDCSSPSAPSPATLVTITPGTTQLMIGSTETFSAFAVSADGNSASVAATWTSSNLAVVTVSSQGLATALGAGVTTITASYQGLSASRTLRVMPSYAGSWSGSYRTTACSATTDPFFCLYEHAPGATSGFVAVFLTQLGDQVSGFVFLDFVNVPVSGTIAVSGELSLTGEVDGSEPPPSFVLIRIANWTSAIDVVSQMLVGRFTHVHAEGTSGHPLSGRVDSELLNVKPIGPP